MIQAADILKKMAPGQRVNYDQVLLKMIAAWQRERVRPCLLLHSCCAPCSTYMLEFLSAFADITVYYTNSNIHPRAEYERRKHVQEQFINHFNKTTGSKVQFLSAPYRPLDYFKRTKGLEGEPEKGKRCSVCFDMRLGLTAEKAKELGLDYFGSALTISPHKDSQVINAIGLQIQKTTNVPYLPSDFKKRGGYARSVEMCGTYAIYRQCYCGCVFAAMQQGIDVAEVAREAKAALAAEEVAPIRWTVREAER
ncbi:MAG: epoxyqueuosine reductase QueH [Sporolactobacillus sp.]